MVKNQYSRDKFINGSILLIDKPNNWTSFQLVNKIRWLIKKKFNLKSIKIGHAGTLDPLAKGLMIIVSGKKTKQIINYQNLDKTYVGTFMLGSTTKSYDLETPINKTFNVDHISLEELSQVKKKFLGIIKQTPPIFSAIKKDGKRLYEYARNNEKVLIPKREIEIKKLDLDIENFPEIKFIVECSKGTYIRSLVHDIGISLNSGAHLTSLCREKIGEYSLKDAMNIDYFEKILNCDI
ncbi:MAG: tRNA pseudouridine(55) synthase TruB [Flavobacteriaceae bacterium TMED200]|nr:tRNA pseudouridine(55) synthase TruB [Flavobacteriaceae bacterium]OUW65662.1 MAG: tRNA pseudouridine(55) synthase TruB [Flavobacteriaceae bacterium TMED200]